MKNTLFLLAFLLVLCLALPFIFNVKYNENFATYPSSTDIQRTDDSLIDASLTDVSFIDASFTEPMTNRNYSIEDKVYSSYDDLIDKNLRNQGHSISDYSRKNPPNQTDEYKNIVESDISVLSFLTDLYKKREGFTTTHTLKDEETKTTYSILPNQQLYNNDGELKLETHDSTDYGALLDKVKKDFDDLKKKYDSDNYVTKGDVSKGLDSLTEKIGSVLGNGDVDKGLNKITETISTVIDKVNTAPSMSSSTMGASTMAQANTVPVNTVPANTVPANIPDVSNNFLPMNAGTTMKQAKCIADFGTNIGDPLCCGQEGTLENTKYTCPSNLPICTGYKCGSNFGTCS